MNKTDSGPDASPQPVENDNSLFSAAEHKISAATEAALQTALEKIDEGILKNPVYAREIQRARTEITEAMTVADAARDAGDPRRAEQCIIHAVIIAKANAPEAGKTIHPPAVEKEQLARVFAGLRGEEDTQKLARGIIHGRRKDAIRAGIPAGVWWPAAKIITARGGSYVWISTRKYDIRALMWAIRVDGMPPLDDAAAEQARIKKIIQIAKIGCREGPAAGGGANTCRRVDMLARITDAGVWKELPAADILAAEEA